MEEHPNRTLMFAEKDAKTHVLYWLNLNKHSKDSFRAYLKKVYETIGIRERYFYKRPVHALRHIGAHRLLELTNYNYDIVAKLGGWTDTKTLKDCYGEMPDSLIMNVVRQLEN
jgi:integrase